MCGRKKTGIGFGREKRVGREVKELRDTSFSTGTPVFPQTTGG